MTIQDLVTGEIIEFDDPKRFRFLAAFGGNISVDDGDLYRRFRVEDCLELGIITKEEARQYGLKVML